MRPKSLRAALHPEAYRAARTVIAGVLDEIPATLVQAALFGSRARGEARPDSDVDILLVFANLPPDREPHAGHAEAIADEVAHRTGVPVTVWSVSLVDLALGNRTPMLVDALEDALPIWSLDGPLPALPFTPPDAFRCVESLLDRLDEGSVEFRDHLDHGDAVAAARRARDDIVRACTALLLLRGITRPRRADTVREALALELEERSIASPHLDLLSWAAASFGPEGCDEDYPFEPPPHPPSAMAAAIDALRRELASRLPPGICLAPGTDGNPMASARLTDPIRPPIRSSPRWGTSGRLLR